jgi:DNA repair photolyase
MSSTTDPYQPIEQEQRITRRLLELFARYDDLDLLVVQTRSPLAARDLDLLARIPYAWLSLTIETDDDARFTDLEGGPLPSRRLALAAKAVQSEVLLVARIYARSDHPFRLPEVGLVRCASAGATTSPPASARP